MAQDDTGPFTLSVLAYNGTPEYYELGPFGQFPVFDELSINLAEPPSAADGNFTWKVEPVDASGT
ncbi:hypothetical protein F4678DRAFT_457867 [Xylaria arbuscula]|nr:hypothetical protein F4678DRAFT_457867 [Xylaria arbuscula]